MKRRKKLGLALAGVAIAAAVVAWWQKNDEQQPLQTPQLAVTIATPGTSPQDWQAPEWAAYFTEGWQQKPPEQLTALPSDVPDVEQASAVARSALLARLVRPELAEGEYEGYVNDPFEGELDTLGVREDRKYDGQCNEVEILGANVRRLENPGGEIAKAVLVWTGDCVDGLTQEVLQGAPRDPQRRQRSFIYLQNTETGWQPVRESQLPNSGGGQWDAGEVIPAAMLTSVRCGGEEAVSVRVEVAAALGELCEAARRDGVTLVVETGLLTDGQARERSGEREKLFENGVCISTHCRGWAVDVSGEGVGAWLQTQIGCMGAERNLLPGAGPCEAGTVVTRAASFGFAQPYGGGHLEWGGGPAVKHWVVNCNPPASMMPAETIAAVWRCELGQKGASRETINDAVSKALVVARCVSGLNVGLYQQNGQQVGAFGVAKPLLDELGVGVDPASVARVAARLYIADRDRGGDGFSYWGCASELPERGGTPVAEWAKSW